MVNKLMVFFDSIVPFKETKSRSSGFLFINTRRDSVAEALKGRVAVITGGGRGIGRAVALEMAMNGADVVVCDFFKDGERSAAHGVVEEILKLGRRGVACEADVATESGGEATTATALKEFGRVDILVNSAGNNLRAPFADMTEEQWDSVMDVHVKGHFFCSRAAARAMIAKGEGGRIVTVASRGAFYALPRQADGSIPTHFPSVVYSAAKAAILGMTSTLALELAKHKITVNSLIPSAETQLFSGTANRGSGGVPQTISLDPAYIAPLIAFLGSDASADITGRFIYASGGDVCFYPRPLQMAGAYFVRKDGKWTVDELAAAIPAIASAGQ
jgi:NAD(P)-dependent dehydrogenase (short-subunit alcohol dehydrogenase family)